MAFDGAFTHNIVEELLGAIDCHIDKIYQPSKDELVFLLRKKGFSEKLVMSARSGMARVHFTEAKYENPAVAPMLCMLARKHFSGAKLTAVIQRELERVVEFCFEGTNEMGDRVPLKIICELIGATPNVILINEAGRVLDALRRSDIESNKRIIQPGSLYCYPESQNKLNLLKCAMDLILNRIFSFEGTLYSALLSSLDGLSPLVCRELVYNCGGEDVLVTDVNKNLLAERLLSLKNDIQNGVPTLLLNGDGYPLDFTFTNISQYGSSVTIEKCESFSALLDRFFIKRENLARIKKAASDILRLVSNAKTRAVKRLAAREQDLKACENRETLRIYGELLKANLYQIPQGSHFAEVQNYYDEALAPIRIPLDPALSPANNAAKYFKDYKKSYTAEQTLTKLIKEDRLEIEYLDSVLDALTRSESLLDLKEIREELLLAGYLSHSKQTRSQKKPSFAFKEYSSKEGYKILVGKNNRQNDELTTKIAAKGDLWFHVKNIPGSHVVVRCAGQEVSEETIVFAAGLAALNSKAFGSSQVPVDYTQIKNVKKPSGAKPGMVIYTTNKTVFVTPKEETE